MCAIASLIKIFNWLLKYFFHDCEPIMTNMTNMTMLYRFHYSECNSNHLCL